MCVLPTNHSEARCKKCEANNETYETQHARLNAAFAKVKSENWKDPINATITATDEEIRVIEDAVIYFTGSLISAQRLKDGRVRIRAAGYYVNIGA